MYLRFVHIVFNENIDLRFQICLIQQYCDPFVYNSWFRQTFFLASLGNDPQVYSDYTTRSLIHEILRTSTHISRNSHKQKYVFEIDIRTNTNSVRKWYLHVMYSIGSIEPSYFPNILCSSNRLETYNYTLRMMPISLWQET